MAQAEIVQYTELSRIMVHVSRHFTATQFTDFTWLSPYPSKNNGGFQPTGMADFGQNPCHPYESFGKVLPSPISAITRDHGDRRVSRPTPPRLFHLCCKQKTSANRPLGDPGVTLGYRLGDAGATQA